MTLEDISTRLAEVQLSVFGALHVTTDETIVLLGPREPGFWPHVIASPEFRDGAPDPLDRWSARVIGEAAQELGGTAQFPSSKPFLPFFTWARQSGRAWPSPVGLLVHDTAGLWVSYRGAIRLPRALPLPEPGNSPCDTCTTRPCLSACPASALTDNGYDVPACHGYLNTPNGQSTCMTEGCAVRAACPISQDYGRLAAQSAYHMEVFHK